MFVYSYTIIPSLNNDRDIYKQNADNTDWFRI